MAEEKFGSALTRVKYTVKKMSPSEKAKCKTNFCRVILACLTLACFLYAAPGARPQTSSKSEGQRAEKAHTDQNEWFACRDFPKTKPEPRIRFGALDKCPQCPKVKPEPEYPLEAKEKGIVGEVRANIIFSLAEGEIVWAQLEGGHPSLREAVKKVVCKVRFKQAEDVDAYVSGTLTYKFALPE